MPPKKNQHDIFAIPKGVPRWPGQAGQGCPPDAAAAGEAGNQGSREEVSLPNETERSGA